MASALALLEQFSTVATNQTRSITTPQQHFDLLHQEAHGTVIVWERLSTGRKWLKLRPGAAEIPQILTGQAGGDDRYMTVNQFYGWRTIDKLQSLRAMYLDIDGCADLNLVLEALHDAALPPPSAAVFSGRGIHLYWLHESTPARALPVWQRCQDTLIKLMRHIGADPAARDCPRVLRLVGSVNIKNSATAHGVVLDEQKWNFHDLCDAILGKREKTVHPSERMTHRPAAAATAVVRDMATARANRGQRPRSGSIYDRWFLVYQDLRAIAQHYGKSGIPEGHRHTWLLLSAVALSWFAHAETIAEELTRQSKIWTPGQTDVEILSALKQPLERAKAASKGLTREYDGEDVDPRFRYKRQTIFGLMKKIIPPELASKLRAIVSDDTKADHEREREMKRDRVTEGRYKTSHADSLSALSPWDALGISRATYYRQRAAGTLPTYQARVGV